MKSNQFKKVIVLALTLSSILAGAQVAHADEDIMIVSRTEAAQSNRADMAGEIERMNSEADALATDIRIQMEVQGLKIVDRSKGKTTINF